MPHLTVEYSNNIQGFDPAAALAALNNALLASEQFDEADVKGRVLRRDHFQVGAVTGARGFVHAELALLSGRSAEVKQKLSASLTNALEALSSQWGSGLQIQISVEIRDMDRASYSKALVVA
jgi:5-carboxymethyl-2-hydroxymuconate isomerase